MADASKINPVRIDKLGEANGVASLDNSGKVPDNQLPSKAINAVQKTGDTITGNLRFLFNNVDKDIPPQTDVYYAYTYGYDKNNNMIGTVGGFSLPNGNLGTRIQAVRKIGDKTYYSQVSASLQPDGTALTTAITPPDNSNGANIATTYWVRKYGVAKSGDTMTGLLKVPTPSNDSNDTTVPTTAWVTSKLSSVSSGGSKSIGEVFYSQSNNAAENPGALPLWTGEYYSNASSLYPNFYTWVKSHTELCKTKVEYDSIISTYGECPYYVIDEIAGSLRLPKLANYIKMANSTDGITQKSAGLPEHDHIMHGKGAIGGIIYLSNNAANYGRSGGETVGKSGTPATTMRTGDASESNSIYGNSTTVTPAHTTLYPWVYAFNSAVEASVAQAAEFNQALTQKANLDLSNVLQNIDYIVDSYSDANGNWYRVYKSGWVEQGGVLAATGTIVRVTFLKPFASTNYRIITGGRLGTGNGYTQGITKDQSTSFIYVSETPFDWYACGQGA